MRQVSLQDMLDAREERAYRQFCLGRELKKPLVSFSMNIPGPVKDSPLIRLGYREGVSRLERALSEAGIAVLRREEKLAHTGCELLLCAEAEAEALKALCLEIEERDRLGRLFDLDVLAPDGRKLDREAPRCCILCGRPGKDCASRRLHSVPELQGAVRDILRESLLLPERRRAEALATAALTEEVNTTPKPGLVDKNNSGAHRDMTPETFYRSAEALRPYWGDCFELGLTLRDETPETCFAALRRRGLEAEKAMFAATGGVNTHKGAIFTLGLLCAAAGRRESADAEELCAEAAALCRKAVEEDFAAARRRGLPQSHGERLYLEQGVTGIRGEVLAGLPAVRETALPALRAFLSEGLSRNDAGVYTLLAIIARGGDSNLLARGGPEKAAWAQKQARLLLPKPPMAAVEALDKAYIAQNLSPGGSADLLAVSYFLYDWERK